MRAGVAPPPATTVPPPAFAVPDPAPSVAGALRPLFRVRDGTDDLDEEPLWTLLDDAATAPILRAALAASLPCRGWFEEHASDVLTAFARPAVRPRDAQVLLDAGVRVGCRAVAALFAGLPKGRGHIFNNQIAKTLCDRSTLVMRTQADFKLVMDAVSETLGRNGKLAVNFQLKQASAAMHRARDRPREAPREKPAVTAAPPAPHPKDTAKARRAQEDAEKKLAVLKLKTHKITAALEWYNRLLAELKVAAAAAVDGQELVRQGPKEEEEDRGKGGGDKTRSGGGRPKEPQRTLSLEQVAEALSCCDSEEQLACVETGVDLLRWDSMSEWNVDITENAHKWFRRHIRKDRALCERILRRLTLLSTGRWPYVLCKPLKSKQLGNQGRKISLYEVSTTRLLVCAVSFKPRQNAHGTTRTFRRRRR